MAQTRVRENKSEEMTPFARAHIAGFLAGRAFTLMEMEPLTPEQRRTLAKWREAASALGLGQGVT